MHSDVCSIRPVERHCRNGVRPAKACFFGPDLSLLPRRVTIKTPSAKSLFVHIDAAHKIEASTSEIRLVGVQAAIPLNISIRYDNRERVVLQDLLLGDYTGVHSPMAGQNKLRSLEVNRVLFQESSVLLRGSSIVVTDSSFVRSLINISNDDFDTSNSLFLSLATYAQIVGCIFQNSTVFVLSNTTEAHHNRFLSSLPLSDGVSLPPIALRYLDSDKDLRRINLPFPRPIDARFNYWGDPSGPSTCCNPAGTGLPVLWSTDFSSWCIVSLLLTLAWSQTDVGLFFPLSGRILHQVRASFSQAERNNGGSVEGKHSCLLHRQSVHAVGSDRCLVRHRHPSCGRRYYHYCIHSFRR